LSSSSAAFFPTSSARFFSAGGDGNGAELPSVLADPTTAVRYLTNLRPSQSAEGQTLCLPCLQKLVWSPFPWLPSDVRQIGGSSIIIKWRCWNFRERVERCWKHFQWLRWPGHWDMYLLVQAY
jgi:hypothetical protein